MRNKASSILVLATTLFLSTSGAKSAVAADSGAAPPPPKPAIAPGDVPSSMAAPAPGEPGSDIPIDKAAGKDGKEMVEVIMLPTTTLQGSAQKKHHKNPVTTYLKNSTAGLGFSLGMLLGPDSMDRDPDVNFGKLTPEQKRTAHIVWNDGSETLVKPTPDGGFTLVGGDSNGTTLKPMEGGGFLVVNNQGQAGKLMPMPAGGFQLSLAGGDVLTLRPRDGGGFDVATEDGELGQIIPGAGGTKYGFYDNSFFQ